VHARRSVHEVVGRRAGLTRCSFLALSVEQAVTSVRSLHPPDSQIARVSHPGMKTGSL
jgi:hypothetical protein